MNSESVDLIYLDPPYNSKADYAAPIGSQAAGAEFTDTWTLQDIDVEWINLLEDRHPALWRVLMVAMAPSDKSYLAYMSIRLLEMHRILKSTGSLFLHCDPTMSHYLKIVLDAVFGRQQFRNEIVWCYKSGGASPKKYFSKKHDIVLWYSKSTTYTFNPQQEKSYNRDMKPYRFKGVEEFEDDVGWYTMVGMKDYWHIDMVGRTSTERTGYPTQKPLALLTRIVQTGSNPNDVVFDPFCGCATTLVAADDLDRSWVGIDVSPTATRLVKDRIKERQGMFQDIVARQDIPKRTDLGKLPVYNSIDNRKKLYGNQGGHCAGCTTHLGLIYL